MQKIALLSMLLCLNVFAGQVKIDGHLGTAYHRNTGTVQHDGDFVDFYLSFDASCYADRGSAYNHVAENVNSFLSWINLEREASIFGALEYDADPINIWRRDTNYYDIDACNGKFYASQAIKLTLHKAAGVNALQSDFIQSFYSELQETIWNLNHIESGDVPSVVSTNISSIEKGIYEETADYLRTSAKAIAQAKATNDFLAFLGPNYWGAWYLQTVDFRETDYSNLKVAVDNYAVPGEIGGSGAPVPAILKLKPLSVSLTGNFVFIFDVRHGTME